MGNIALSKIATASSYVLPFSPNKAVDGFTAPLNRWVCNSVSTAYPGWLMVDMGSQKFVNRWVVKHMCVGGFTPSEYYANRDYKLQGSNDSVSWTDIDTVTGNTQSTTDRTTAIVNFRYYRVSVTSGLNANKGLASIEELEIYEAPVPFLINLTLSSGILNPAFNSAVYNYTASVGYDVTSITVTATSGGTASTMTVDGVTTTSGQPSAPISLNVGANTVTVQLTSPGVPVQTYTVAVTRASSPYLTNITFDKGSLATPFEKNTLTYNANIQYDGTQVYVTPTAEDPAAAITVNGSPATSGVPFGPIAMPNIGNNAAITIVVTSKQGADSRTYTITPTRASDCYLSGLLIVGIRGGGLTPAFDRATYAYTSNVANSVASVQIQATAENGGNITVNGISVQSGQPSQPINLQVSTNLVTVVCSSETGVDSKTYEITITRAAQ